MDFLDLRIFQFKKVAFISQDYSDFLLQRLKRSVGPLNLGKKAKNNQFVSSFLQEIRNN